MAGSAGLDESSAKGFIQTIPADVPYTYKPGPDGVEVLEIRHNPAFNEDIDTVTGKPHGNILYSWNSGYRWLRESLRKRLNQTGPDPVGTAIDAHLGVVRENGVLRLEPKQAEQDAKAPAFQGPQSNRRN